MIVCIVAKHANLLLLLLLVVANGQQLVPRQRKHIFQEKAALLAFKSKLTPETRGNLSNWNETTEVCQFVGVECNWRQLHVKNLNLSKKGISGPISPVVSNITHLQILDLSGNFLTGYIPNELANLRRLRYIELSGNHLIGNIPPSLAFLPELIYLDLGDNYLTGQVPESIFYNCTHLSVLDISNNGFSGPIPSSSDIQFPKLVIFNLYLNYFYGNLPSWLSNSSYMQQIDIENNNFSGELPSDIIKSMDQLQVLHLSYNNFNSFKDNSNLEKFFIALSNCSSLKELEMARLHLHGLLPRSIGNCSKSLTWINLEDNMISGKIPPDIANLSNLTLLNLSSNLFNSTIPIEICQLQMLQGLILSNNSLEGAVPSGISNLSSLDLLDFSSNKLSNQIPESLGKIARISQLFLHRNQLSGAIPNTLGECKSLRKLDLSYNKLEGRIPPEISGIAKIFFNISHNLLQGSLPLELSKMDQVEEIDLSSNNLTGDIIPQLSECIALKLLDLSNNQLSGQIPTKFGDLPNLETLDLSYNHLEGEIPLSLNKCSKLTMLNLSYNNLSGWIPTGGIFSLFSYLSYIGNPYLCGSNNIKACSKQHHRWLRTSKFLLVITISASIGAFLLTICCVVTARMLKRRILNKRKDTVGSSSPFVKSSYPRITYRELVEATRDFDQGRLVGTGSYGRVYRGVLSDGTIVAVKVLNLQTGNSTKSFTRECQVLKRIRHRNLMRIITACSLPDFKALVLPFMTNGSLDHCLYSGSFDLSLIERVNICSDVAEGMAYLHHHSPVKVIHCDLKPSNILLNDDMTALVSDFGISRLVTNLGVGSTTENMGNSTAVMLRGSIGYIAPEYGYGSNTSAKGDVYSFGVLVLEVVTRKRPTDEMFEDGLNLHNWVKSHHHERTDNIIDASLALATRDQRSEIKRMWEVAITELLELGLLCTQESPTSRPTMLDAADDLDRLKRYLSGDTTATFASSLGMSSSTFGETSLSNFDDGF